MRRTQLLRNPRSNTPCRDTARLRMANGATDAKTGFHRNQRKLSRLAAARFTANHDDLVVANRLGDFVFAIKDRKFGVKLQFRQTSATLLQPLC